ncbi:hypothetical protein EZV62_028306 [Acer yangbiense]|uniref:Uncharacterized protein n=1 Tax=Acer yangbiense TaxID=1000413 RepID=A0A5C7GPF8_9ROSI|nr:hypothetical protein EZV62_028306 [Acer yangbiense]
MCSLMSWIQIWMIRQKTFQQRRGRVGSRVAVGLEKNDDLLTNSPIPSSKKGRGRLEDGVVGNAIFVHGRSIKSLNFSLSWISPVSVTGTAAGISSTLVCHPLEVLKLIVFLDLQDRLTVSRDVYPSLSIAISKIYKDGGIGAFYAGLSPTLIGMLPYSTCYYFMYKTMKKSYCKSKNKKSLTVRDAHVGSLRYSVQASCRLAFKKYDEIIVTTQIVPLQFSCFIYVLLRKREIDYAFEQETLFRSNPRRMY